MMIGKEIGPYRILEKIGEGGMGIVFKGLHIKLEQEVAVKALSPALSHDPVMKERFISEAKIQAKLSHPNVANILNYLEEGENVYLVMEFIKGETLEKRLLREGALPAANAITIALQVLDALSFMHSKGIIHRDIKPSNIMTSEDGRVKVTDFGIAKLAGERGHTKTGVKIGTLWYMPPEVIKGERATVLSDIYSLGISLFQMTTGRVPYTGDSEYKVMKGHLEDKPPPPWEINSNVSREVGRVICKALAKVPEERPHTAKEFQEELKAAIKKPEEGGIRFHLPIRVSQWNIPSLHLDKRNLLIVLVGLGIVLLLLITIFLFFPGAKKEDGKIPLAYAPDPPTSYAQPSEAKKEEQPPEVPPGKEEGSPLENKAKQSKSKWKIRK